MCECTSLSSAAVEVQSIKSYSAKLIVNYLILFAAPSVDCQLCSEGGDFAEEMSLLLSCPFLSTLVVGHNMHSGCNFLEEGRAKNPKKPLPPSIPLLFLHSQLVGQCGRGRTGAAWPPDGRVTIFFVSARLS